MKSWLFALGLALCCTVRAEWVDMTKTSDDQASGKWYTLACASTSEQMLGQLSQMPVFPSQVTKTEEDDIRITVSFPMGKQNQCNKIVTVFKRREDGKYHGHCGDAKVTLEKAMIMGDYAMISCTFEMGNTHFRSTTLHGRTPAENPEIKQTFIDECKKLDYSNNQILLLNFRGEICK